MLAGLKLLKKRTGRKVIMMNTEMIEQLALIFGESGRYVVDQYAHWFIVSSFVWVLLGVGLIALAWLWKFPEDWEGEQLLFKVMAVILGGLFIGCNLPDLISPEGIALHQLITDITGH